ncbi:hypothetical protein FRC19_008449 [Serendipita sp. 401]|nr:hypothetical protein FRC16_007560 [Serendipita sp. 398]KAG8826620.1 hypothetical protein FRC19_008449 [Serendipita sp. 401]
MHQYLLIYHKHTWNGSLHTGQKQLLKEFHECLGQLDKRNRVLIISGSKPGAFCAGADLAERRTMSTSEVNQFLVDLRSAIHTLENMDVPTIAAIDGPALGGGLELALACDLRVAGRQATKIGLPETKLGIIPGAGGTQRLTRLLGVSKAKELVFTGRALSPEQALSYGVVDYITDSGLSKALELAEEMSSGGRRPLRFFSYQLTSKNSAVGFEGSEISYIKGSGTTIRSRIRLRESLLPAPSINQRQAGGSLGFSDEAKT